ncbi:MAG TPA: efflux RND transporter periplasmic adaptor subunit [Steroidobacteraceae bacterium]|nr:efflux RND transporter periplasmic adaptor subunit [Steroidobacteraceae bacterium]
MSSEIPPFDADPAAVGEMSRAKKIAWGAILIAIVVVTGLIVHARIAAHRNVPNFVRNNRGGAGFPGGIAPLAVGVAQVTRGDVPVTIDALGTVTPLATVTVHPQVTGPLIKIDFSEGQMVKAGQVLAEIDPRPFQAALDQAQGQLAHDQALLANARVDLTRYKTLVAQNSVAEQTYATQQATVLQDEATVTADKAVVETDTLNLSYCHISSPVNGTVGLRQVDVGNVVSAYSSSIAVVTQLQPMSVLFTVPEDSLSQVLQRLRSGDKLPVDAYDRTFTTKLDTGVLTNTDNQVDTTTGTLKLRAMFNNKDFELFPNQFVNARLTLDTLHDQLLIPGAAVQQGSTGNFVYVVDDSASSDAAAAPPLDPPPGAPGRQGRGGNFGGGAAGGPIHVVHVRYVTTGPTVGTFISITQGLQVGETVVVDGAEQLRDGARVTTPNASTPQGAPAGTAVPGAGTGAHGGYNAQPGAAGRGMHRRGGQPPGAAGTQGSAGTAAGATGATP